MNIIYQLFDQPYIASLFNKKVLPFYPDFKSIKKIKILPHKKQIWETTYHVVIEYETSFLTNQGKIVKLPIYCSANSNEDRKNSFAALKFLWNNNFSKGRSVTARPLFFLDSFNALFYRGIEGKNLYQFIREKNYQQIEMIVPRAAAWLAKLHHLPLKEAKNFNKINSRIETVIPGVKHILDKIKSHYPSYFEFYNQAYEKLITQENKFFSNNKKRWLVHGDAHPENVIKIGKTKTAIIDFTDICLADFARDLGSFSQQLDYMITRKMNNSKYAQKAKKIFFANYLKNAKIKLDDGLKKRIDYYYHYTALRTATYFLLKHDAEPERAEELIKKIKNNF